jgi:hypothetical protein
LVIGWWMMLGKIVGLIGFSRLPVDNELDLFDQVADPVETHVHGFGLALLYRVVGMALITFAVCLEGSGGCG